MGMTRDKLRRNFGLPKGAFSPKKDKPKSQPSPKPKSTTPKTEKPWWKFWRQGGHIKNYANGGGVRPANNEYS